MYLFQLIAGHLQNGRMRIYIPLCIYFNTLSKILQGFFVNLHSTMYLFQPRDINETQKDNIIYIPLCIYFNTADFGTDFVLIFIYIPLCIYFNIYLIC